MSIEEGNRIITDTNGKLTTEVEGKDLYIWFNGDIIMHFYNIRFNAIDKYDLNFITKIQGRLYYHHLPLKLFCDEQIKKIKTFK